MEPSLRPLMISSVRKIITRGRKIITSEGEMGRAKSNKYLCNTGSDKYNNLLSEMKIDPKANSSLHHIFPGNMINKLLISCIYDPKTQSYKSDEELEKVYKIIAKFRKIPGIFGE